MTVFNFSHKMSLRRTCAGLFALTIAMACHPATADDPFTVDNGHWMSFEHYKDADHRGVLPPIPLPDKTDAAADEAPKGAAIAAATAAIAQPTRPIDLPVMPGLNKGFAVNVHSTEDDHNLPASAQNVTIDNGEPNLALSDKNWQAPQAREDTGRNSEDGSDETPLKVRMSFLPSSKVPPAPSPEHASAEKLSHDQLRKSLEARYASPPPAIAAKTPAQQAACAAIDAYHKQQLTAIKSDRQTLAALQDAIHSLGLDKQLDFMAGTNGSVSASSKAPIVVQ